MNCKAFSVLYYNNHIRARSWTEKHFQSSFQHFLFPSQFVQRCHIGWETSYLQVPQLVYLTMKKSCRSHWTVYATMICGEKMWAWHRSACLSWRRLKEVVLVFGIPGGGRRWVFQPKVSLTKARVDAISGTSCRICMKNDQFAPNHAQFFFTPSQNVSLGSFFSR